MANPSKLRAPRGDLIQPLGSSTGREPVNGAARRCDAPCPRSALLFRQNRMHLARGGCARPATGVHP
eukprot:6201619-Pleurochrysis_carterae.AAC.1